MHGFGPPLQRAGALLLRRAEARAAARRWANAAGGYAACGAPHPPVMSGYVAVMLMTAPMAPAAKGAGLVVRRGARAWGAC